METRICRKCKQNLLLTKEFYYNKRRKSYSYSCKKCNGSRCTNYQAEKRKNGDINFILRGRAANIKRTCKHRSDNREVAANLQDILLAQYKKQNGKCYYTGEDLTLSDYHHDKNFATVDRLDSKLGYVEGNVVFCKSIINKMKQDLTIEELQIICKQILAFSPPVSPYNIS